MDFELINYFSFSCFYPEEWDDDNCVCPNGYVWNGSQCEFNGGKGLFYF
jgi:hypothetical protein